MRSYRIAKRALSGIFSGYSGAFFAGTLILLAAVAAVVGLSTGKEGDDRPPPAAQQPRPPSAESRPEAARVTPSKRERHRIHQARVRARATTFAAGRDGRVAFAVAGADGAVRGLNEHELFQSASLVKSLILAAELERLDREGLQLDPSTRSTLTSMIEVSDNDAATTVFDRVGPEGVEAVAHRAGMVDLETSTIWGATRISAADMAVMFSDLDRILPEHFERFGKDLLGSIAPEQSWGIPAVAGKLGWNARFKGGWRMDPTGQVVNQAAELNRGGTTVAMAILTDEGPSMPYGIETVEGVATRLLGGG